MIKGKLFKVEMISPRKISADRKKKIKGKAKKEKQKSLKRLGKTFWHVRTKKCHKPGCYCKERHAFMFNFE